jgi:glycosyltransferase involved in cell wall biosynthesis
VINVSVIICTYNGSKTIIHCLNHLLKQKTSLDFEILIVDNNSNDDTKVKVQQFIDCNKSKKIKLFLEYRRGKVFALQTGILRSLGEVIVICDDDNFFESDFLDEAYRIMKSDNKIGLAAGVNNPISSIPLPPWFEINKSYFGCGCNYNKEGDITHKGFLWGAGMVCRGDLLRMLYSSNLKHLMGGSDDKNGNRTISCEDNELCIWVKLLGYKLWYSHSLRLNHFMIEERLNEQYLNRLKETSDKNSKELSQIRMHEIFYHATNKLRFSDIKNIFSNSAKGKGIRIKCGLLICPSQVSINVQTLTMLIQKETKDN